MKQANVSKHLGMLHLQRLVRRQREGIWIRYASADAMVFELCDLVCWKVGRDANSAAGSRVVEPGWLACVGWRLGYHSAG